MLTLGTACGIANWAAQIAVITNFDQGEAGMLLMIGAQAAIVRTAPFNRRVVNLRHLRRLYINFTAAPVVFHIVSDQNSLVTMLRATLQHEDLAVLEHS